MDIKEIKIKKAAFEDFGLELSRFSSRSDYFGLFYRADYSGRYSRFIFCREVWEIEQLVKVIEALTDFSWDPANAMYGNYFRPEQAKYYREQDQKRLDRQIVSSGKWQGDERDETRAVRK